MSWRRERNDSSCIFAAVSGREPCWCVKWGLHRAVAKATLGEVPLLVLLAHGSELGERWAGSWVTQRAQAPATRWESSQRGRRGAVSASLGAAKVPNSFGGWPWSLDLVKVCRALLFARGASWSRAKAAATAGTVCTNTAAGEVPVQREAGEHWESMGCKGTGGDNGSAGSCQGLQIHPEN